MTDTEQPDTPPLTRKQLREMRNTGATPVIPAEAPTTDSPAQDPAASEITDARSEPEAPESAVEPAPLPRPAEPVAVSTAPIADSAVDLGVAPLTRRQARQQERIRTASVPVITPDAAAAHAASAAGAAAAPISAVPTTSDVDADAGTPDADTAAAATTDADTTDAGEDRDALASIFAPPADEADAASAEPQTVDSEVDHDEAADVEDAEPAFDDVASGSAASEEEDSSAEPSVAEPEEESERVVNPALGAAVIAGEPVQIDLPPSFDQLLAQGSTGSIGTPNALIVSQTGGDASIISPVTSTGEIIVTGTFSLPEGLGSTGHAAGTADGKDVDAVLVDGELPAHSSPTPIAASAAISTVKSAGEVIKPPAPEKGGRLMMWLAITAGVLALALVGVLILAFVTGVL